MKLKFKLNLQQFGNIRQRLDEVDNDADNSINVGTDDTITFKHNGKTYQLPESVFDNIHPNNWFGIGEEEDAQDLILYARYAMDQREAGLETGTLNEFKQWVLDNDAVLKGDFINNTDNYNTVKSKTDSRIVDAFSEEGYSGKRAFVSGGPSTDPGLTPPGLTPPGSGDSDSTEPGSVNVSEDQIGAFNAYYNDIYSLAPGTGGANMLNRLEQSYTNQAQQAATMADVGFQQAAMQQASTVKQITDQVRGERLARLRAGMSEAQIANQDMQMLMTNVNTLNQNAQMLNDQRLQAQIGINTAQDQAYTDFLAQSNQRGQVGAAMAASDAGDAYQQTIRQMTTLYGADPSKWTAAQWTETSNRVSTGNPAGNVTR